MEADRGLEYSSALDERITFVQADIRSYVYLRIQPGFWGTSHGLGGGNFSSALCLFALLSVLSKVYRAVTKPERFVDGSGSSQKFEVNETDAFTVFVRWLRSTQGMDLGINDTHSPRVWDGFRNWLFHRFTTSHSILTVRYHALEGGVPMGSGMTTNATTIEADAVLKSALAGGHLPFQVRADGRIEFCVDLLYARLDDLRKAMTELLRSAPLKPRTTQVLDDLLLARQA